MEMKIEKIGNEVFGLEQEEIVIRDNNGAIVAYALLDPADPNYENERKMTLLEFKSDFLK